MLGAGLPLAGAGAGVVALCTAAGVALAAPRPARRQSPLAARVGPVDTPHVLAGVVCAGVVGYVTHWPAAAVWAAVGAWVAVGWRAQDRARATAVTILDAQATWAGLVRGQLATGRGLAPALLSACDRAPAVLAPDMAALKTQLLARPTAEAVRAWSAQGVGDAEGRQVACVLEMATAGRGGSVADLLGQLADQLRARATAARRIERERRRIRLAARVIIALTLAWVLGGARFDHQLFGFYDGLSGQVALALVLGFMAIGIRGLARLDRDI